MSSGIIGWNEQITSTRMPQCFRCVHHFGKENNRRCKAFPEKNIPPEYLFGKVKHELVLENQIGNFVYEVKEIFKEQDEQYELIEKKAISEFDSNKKQLPIIIREKLKKEGADLGSIEKLEIKSSGPLRSRFFFQIEFFPEEEVIKMDCSRFEGRRIAAKIITALEAKNLEPKFKLTIFKDGNYKYE